MNDSLNENVNAPDAANANDAPDLSDTHATPSVDASPGDTAKNDGSGGARAWVRAHWVALALTAILLLAAFLRFPALEFAPDKDNPDQTVLTFRSWDGDHHLHPDERFLTMVSSAIRLPSSPGEYFDTDTSPMNPYNNNFGSFVYGTAPLFIVRIAAELVRMTDYWNIHMVGRILSALFDVFTCAMVFFIGRRLFGAHVGLFAALMYALAVLPIQQSHFMTVDAFGNVPLVLAFWFTLDIAEGKRGRWAYVFAGMALGLAVASRINFATFAAIIVLAALLRLVTLLNPVKRVALASSDNALAESKTYATDAGIVVDETASAPSVAQNPHTRTIQIGPLIFEIESRAPTSDASSVDETERAHFWNSVLFVATGLALTAFAALLVFRVAQPYAFKGLFSLNPKWLDDMKFIGELISGQIDYPPSHQWTGRAAYLFPLYNIFNYGLGFPGALAAFGGFVVGMYEILRHRKWNHLLMALWVGGFFLYLGQQFVLVVRYYLPLYPFFAIYAGFFVFWLWKQATQLRVPWRAVARVATLAFIAVVVGYTFFWANAFASIYTRPVSRIVASDWLRANVPPGAKIANEHWDDPLPFGGYQGLESSSDGLMQNYGEDGPEKRDQLQAWLDEADYIVLSSNRLYQSIPRLPLRFPLTTKYYEWLFNGALGFDKVQEFTSYPQLFGIVINDDSSDEAFTVYDHPKVLVFKKSARYSSENTAQLLNSVDLSEIEKLKPIDYVASKNGFRMSPQVAAANYAGGTWSDIFNPNDWVNQIPLLAWLAAIWAIGIIAYPYAFMAFRQFTDRGYAFTKILGVLALAWLTWTLASYQVLPFERTTMLLVLAALLAGAVVIAWFQRAELSRFVRARWKLLLGIELVYLAFFAIDLAIRYGNPDLWHPWFGGEKPMDFAYLNAVIKTTYFPAYNPWFEGGFINYYYFGQVISATLVKLVGVVPEVAYNLLLPTFFALTASGAFGVAFNLVNRGGKQETGDLGLETNLNRESSSSSLQSRVSSFQSPILLRAFAAGVIAAVFVLILGNLGQVGVLFKGLNDLGQSHGGTGGVSNFLTGLFTWLGGQEIPVPIGNWYWTATRVIPDTINEFPFFTFVYADLHAHLMALPFTLAGLGIAAHAVLNRAQLKWYDLGIAAMVLGALRAINTWDFPTYLALIGCAMVLGFFADASTSARDDALDVPGRGFNWSEFIQRYLWLLVLVFAQIAVVVIPTNAAGVRVTFDMAIFILVMLFALVFGLARFGLRLDPRAVGWKLGWRMAALVALSVAFYFPYILNYGTAYTSVELWKDARTVLSDYFVVHGIFLFLTATYFGVLLFNASARTLRETGKPVSTQSLLDGWLIYLVPALVVLEVGLVFLGLHVFALVAPFLAVGVWILFERETHIVHRFLALVLLAALLLTVMVEVVTLKGDIGRMNTVFKFYLQAWVFFAVANVAGLALVFRWLWFRDAVTDAATGEKVGGDSSALQTAKAAWWGIAALLIFAGMLYPAFAAWAKVNDRFVAGSAPGLNGLEYMKQAVYNTHDQEIPLIQDYQAIQWLRENVKGSPVIFEANDSLYRWGNRISINTGLPTTIGWDWHTKQQYSLLPGEIVDNRIRDVNAFYQTTDPTESLELLRRYNVSLVYVGPLERVLYGEEGLAKFEAMADAGVLKQVYDNDGVQIYAVSDKVAQVVK